MLKAYRYLPVALVVAVLAAAPACASRGNLYRYPSAARVDDRAYRDGYDQGRARGEDDARRGRPLDYLRHRDYRRADVGYGGYGNRNAYREGYRRGFADGYNDGYRRYARAGRGRGPAPYVYGGQRPVPRYASPAADNGYRDGFEQGRKDARDGNRFDPIRARQYRSGDHDYNSRYGSRDDYKREYRAAFQRGYEQGYRQFRR